MKKIVVFLILVIELVACNKAEIEINPFIGTWKQITSTEHKTDDIMIFKEDSVYMGPKLNIEVYNYQYFYTKDHSHLFLYNLDNEEKGNWKVDFTYGKITLMTVHVEDKCYFYEKIR